MHIVAHHMCRCCLWQISVLIKPGKAPKVRWSKAKEAGKEEEDAAEQPPIIHKPKGPSDFTVYTGYLEPECSP